jgi:uncharacterized protein (TIGR03083 family)
VEHAERVEAVARESVALADALGDGPRGARVPSCPDWTVADLAAHVGNVTGFWTHVLCEGTGRPKPPMPPDDGDLDDWYRGLASSLVDELRVTPPDTPVWTYADDKSAGFVARRLTHELAVHRFDAQLARGRPGPLAPALAADGIEELFVMVGVRDAGRASGQTLHLHGTDRDDEWLLVLDPGGLRVERAHAKADLALRAAVSDLELVLYQRPPLGPVEHLGDDDVLTAWYRAFTF